jgi:periplasmic divalent cation tolerance protein
MNLPPETGSNALLVLTTAESEDQARGLAGALLERRLAACVNLLPGLRSLYRWQGELRDDREILLLIKTTTGRFEEVRSTIRELHSYELPEILALPVDRGDSAFLAWLSACVEPAPGADQAD